MMMMAAEDEEDDEDGGLPPVGPRKLVRAGSKHFHPNLSRDRVDTLECEHDDAGVGDAAETVEGTDDVECCSHCTESVHGDSDAEGSGRLTPLNLALKLSQGAVTPRSSEGVAGEPAVDANAAGGTKPTSAVHVSVPPSDDTTAVTAADPGEVAISLEAIRLDAS